MLDWTGTPDITVSNVSAGIVTGTAFHGDGSNVTGISTLNISNYGVGLGGGGGIGTDGSVNTVGIITAGAFFTTGIITAANFVGSGEGLTGVASTDNIQTATDATFLANVNISGITTLANTKISGITTATNKIEVRSDDGSEGRIDFYCEVSNAHYTRIQACSTCILCWKCHSCSAKYKWNTSSYGWIWCKFNKLKWFQYCFRNCCCC